MGSIKERPIACMFQCDWPSCTKSFKRKSDLPRHYRTHTNERPYACPVPKCDKSFIQRCALTVHIRTHTGEKPHQCPQFNCWKRFSNSSSLARHRRVHVGTHRYKCAFDGCPTSFRRKADMLDHEQRLHKGDSSPGSIAECHSLDLQINDPNPAPLRSVLTRSPFGMVLMNEVFPHDQLYVPSSCDDFNQAIYNFNVSQRYDTLRDLPSSLPHEFLDQPIPNCHVSRSTSLSFAELSPRIHCFTDQGDLDVITATGASQPHHQFPLPVERPLMDITLATKSPLHFFPWTLSATLASKPEGQDHPGDYFLENPLQYRQARCTAAMTTYLFIPPSQCT